MMTGPARGRGEAIDNDRAVAIGLSKGPDILRRSDIETGLERGSFLQNAELG
jgi:hypothetical protein